MADDFKFDGSASVSAPETRSDAPPVDAEGMVVRPLNTALDPLFVNVVFAPPPGPLVVDQGLGGVSPWLISLPADAARESKQDTEIAGLGAIFVRQADGSQHTLVDNFPAVQPVSGTITANQGTVPWVVSDPPVEAALDVALSTRASEATLATRATEATLLTRATEATLLTRASEATLATRLADATFTGRINTFGQKVMAASTPVVIASDQSAIPVTVGTVTVNQGTSPWVVSDPPVEAALDVALSTRASEATLATRASEATLLTRASEATLATRASEATLATRLADATFTARIDVALSTRASEATLATRASEATLATRASEATLATRLADATFIARINTLGQKVMAASTPVVIASDQSAIPVNDNSTGTLNNGVETAVAAVAVQLIAASATRRGLIIQNTGVANIRVGAAGVAPTTGFRLVPGQSVTFTPPYQVTNAVFAIREGLISSIGLAQDLT